MIVTSTPCSDNHSAPATGLSEGSARDAGEFVFPATIFDREEGWSDSWWTCVRTRPRWEKKFARWLSGERIPHFLPTFNRTTVSHRKRRVTIEPLFPGYVFVNGDHQKERFTRSGSVVRLLKPRSQAETEDLDRQLADVWHASVTGLQLVPIHVLTVGQQIEILDGPMQGTIGCFQRMARQECIIVAIDMLGVGVSVELPPDCRYTAVE